jgi:hypothetical protein
MRREISNNKNRNFKRKAGPEEVNFLSSSLRIKLSKSKDGR